jgi:hypothetical protein
MGIDFFMNKWHKYIYLLLILIIFSASSAIAGEQGHYSPAPMAIRDLVVPPKGVYFLNYNTYYTADTFKDSNGDELDSLSVSGSLTRNISIRNRSVPITITGTLDIDLNLDIDVFAQALGVAVVTDKKILGANYGFIILPSWGYTSGDVKAEANAAGTISVGGITRPFSAGESVSVEDEKTGLADFFVQPLWLGWHGKHYDIGFSWGAYLPTGAYDENEISNVGYGFFTSQTQASFYYYPFEDQSTAIMFAPTWEWHSKNIDKDVQPGQNVTIEYGIGQYLHERFEIGVHGFHQWQITDDSGDDAVNKDTKDRGSGVGGQVTWWPIKDRLALVGKFVQEYGTEDRLEGQFGEFNITWIF